MSGFIQHLFNLKWEIIRILRDTRTRLLISHCTWHEVSAIDTGRRYITIEVAEWRGFAITHRSNTRDYPPKITYVAKEGGDYTTIQEAIDATENEPGYRHQIYIRSSRQPSSGE